MSDFLTILFEEILNTSYLEYLAFISSVLYVLFAAKEHIICWVFAIISSLIYIYLFFSVNLYLDSGLQFFYVIMAFVGWVNWKKKSQFKIRTWKIKNHIYLIAINLLFIALLAYIFEKYTDQAYPIIDASIFCFSISATYLVALKLIENWLYFVVIDFVALFVYWQRDLKLTSILFLIYTFLALFAYFSWLKKMKESQV
jgi:nicotinamide mononucleotide transporter